MNNIENYVKSNLFCIATSQADKLPQIQST